VKVTKRQLKKLIREELENTKELDEVFGLFGDSRLEKLVQKNKAMYQKLAQDGPLNNMSVPDSFPLWGSSRGGTKGAWRNADVRGAPEEHIEAVIDFLARANVADAHDAIPKMGERKSPVSVTSQMYRAYQYFFNPDRESGSWEKDKEKQAKDAAWKQGAPGREKAAAQRRAGKQQDLLNALMPWKERLDSYQNGIMSRKGIIRDLNRDGITDLEKAHGYLKDANAALRAATQLLRTPEGKKALGDFSSLTSNPEGFVQDLTKMVQHLKQLGRDEESVRSRDKHVDDREVATDTHYGAGGARKRKSDFQRTSRFNESQLKQIIKEELEAALSENKRNKSNKFKDTDLSKISNDDLTRMLGDNNVAFGNLTGANIEDFDQWTDDEHDRLNAIDGTAELHAINRDIRVALRDKSDRRAGTNVFGF
jgi:hypothetical protein